MLKNSILYNLSLIQVFIEETDKNLKQHYRLLDELQHLLDVKSDIDEQYAKSNRMISESFKKLTLKSSNTKINNLVIALSRNFSSVAENLQQMAYDLKTDLNVGLSQGVIQTKHQLSVFKKALESV